MHYKQYKSILSPKGGMNIYRGCTHGCIYCDSRSKCYQMDHDFEDIEIKTDAPKMLKAELLRKRKKCVIKTGAMTDPYIHLEEDLKYTRQCLEIIAETRFGLAIQTKSNRILRDLDLLKSINEQATCTVEMTLTTYDENLCKILEPNVCTTKERFEVLKTMRDSGIPTVVWLCPILPFLNDTEENLRGILSYLIEAEVKGVISFGMGVTLRDGSREYFYRKLDQFFPGLKQKYHQKYGYSYIINSDNNKQLTQLFYSECKKHGIISNPNKVFEFMHEYREKKRAKQLSLFSIS